MGRLPPPMIIYGSPKQEKPDWDPGVRGMPDQCATRAIWTAEINGARLLGAGDWRSPTQHALTNFADHLLNSIPKNRRGDGSALDEAHGLLRAKILECELEEAAALKAKENAGAPQLSIVKAGDAGGLSYVGEAPGHLYPVKRSGLGRGTTVMLCSLWGAGAFAFVDQLLRFLSV